MSVLVWPGPSHDQLIQQMEVTPSQPPLQPSHLTEAAAVIQHTDNVGVSCTLNSSNFPRRENSNKNISTHTYFVKCTVYVYPYPSVISVNRTYSFRLVSHLGLFLCTFYLTYGEYFTVAFIFWQWRSKNKGRGKLKLKNIHRCFNTFKSKCLILCDVYFQFFSEFSTHFLLKHYQTAR